MWDSLLECKPIFGYTLIFFTLTYMYTFSVKALTYETIMYPGHVLHEKGTLRNDEN